MVRDDEISAMLEPRGSANGGGGDPRARVTEMGVLGVVSGQIKGKSVASADIFGSPPEESFERTNNEKSVTITIKPVRSDNDYLRKLTGRLANDYQIYLKLRDDYINSPTFYFDMADWFYRHNDRETALRILTSIAELELESAPLYRMLGYRFKEYGEHELQKFVTKKVLKWRPMEPQSYRDYALALADNGEPQAALDSLNSLLARPFSANISRRSRRIEEVIVTEINHLIAKHPNLNISEIDERLIIDIPVDIRVVINWNMNNVVIDLHVDGHNYEMYYCSSCNRFHRSNIREHMSANNASSGYGPEQFIVKKAANGKYRIYVDYRGAREFAAAGPTTVMAEVFTNYAGKNEQRKIVCLQLSNVNRYGGNKVLVAEFRY
jgi:hypothetical protein